jgi:type IV pilus assembly protein PilF
MMFVTNRLLRTFAGTLLICFSISGCGSGRKDGSNDSLGKNKVDYKLASNLNVELGLGYLQQGQISRAKQKLMHALELQPENPSVHNALGYFWETVGDNSEAEKSYQQAIKLSNTGEFLNDFGTFLCKQKRYAAADEMFMQAIDDNKYQGTAEAYENAGICAWQSGQEEKAIQYLETAIVRDPHRYDALLSLAEINLKNKKYLIAKDYLKRFNATTNSTAYSILLEIKLSQQQDDFRTAKDKVLLLKKLFPDSNEYHEYLRSKHAG